MQSGYAPAFTARAPTRSTSERLSKPEIRWWWLAARNSGVAANTAIVDRVAGKVGRVRPPAPVAPDCEKQRRDRPGALRQLSTCSRCHRLP